MTLDVDRQWTVKGRDKSILYLDWTPAAHTELHCSRHPRFVLHTVLAPRDKICPFIPTYASPRWAKEELTGRVTHTVQQLAWARVRGTYLETDVRRLVQERLLAEHNRWPSCLASACCYLLLYCYVCLLVLLLLFACDFLEN
ncbi:hypothetical protein LZ31DRAFT_245597 [Colletotrichum somersetense]|nr:hypothetical protein LZ31DRAFT_245597 [Colletotrichum somersetense]